MFASALQPQDPVVHDLLGVALAAGGKSDRAEASFNKALQLAPDYEDAREHLRRLTESDSDSVDLPRLATSRRPDIRFGTADLRGGARMGAKTC